MNVTLINPFLTAALEVLEQETGQGAQRGQPYVADLPLVADDLSVLVGVVGDAQGVVLYSLPAPTVLGLVGHMLGQPVSEIDELVASGIAELGNVITGRASTLLEQAGYACNIAPPSVIKGKGSRISTLAIPSVAIPLQTGFGPLLMYVALKG